MFNNCSLNQIENLHSIVGFFQKIWKNPTWVFLKIVQLIAISTNSSTVQLGNIAVQTKKSNSKAERLDNEAN